MYKPIELQKDTKMERQTKKEEMREEGGEEEPDTEDSLGSGGSQQDEVFLPQSPLLIWAKGMDRADRMMFLTSALQWYVDCGKFAENTGGRKIKIVNLL